MNVLITTQNAHGLVPLASSTVPALSPWFLSHAAAPPDLIVIGLQELSENWDLQLFAPTLRIDELVRLHLPSTLLQRALILYYAACAALYTWLEYLIPKSNLRWMLIRLIWPPLYLKMMSNFILSQWQQELQKAIEHQYPAVPYTCMVKEAYGNLGLFVFHRSDSQWQSLNIKIGSLSVSPWFSNKGALAAEFIFKADDTIQQLTFVNAHLPAHEGQVKARNEAAKHILKQLLVFDDQHSHALNLEQSLFFFGDLNYRLDLSRDEFKRMFAQNQDDLDGYRMLEHDELRKIMKSSLSVYSGLKEAHIQFPPTYKLQQTSHRSDEPFSIEHVDLHAYKWKRRLPAWCDRILYSSISDRIHTDKYRVTERALMSDHDAVQGHFVVQPSKVASPQEGVSFVVKEQYMQQAITQTLFQHLVFVLRLLMLVFLVRFLFQRVPI